MKREWEVEWCESVPVDKYGDADIDAAVMRCRRFKTEAEARTFAKKAASESYWGVADLRAVEPTTSAAIIADDEGEIEYWIEKGQPMMYVGKNEVVEA